MTPIIAEISAFDPPVLIVGFCACLMFLFMGANAAMDFWRNIKDKPTGSEVMEKARAEFQPIGKYQPAGDYITRSEWNQREQTLSASLKTLSEENTAILNAGAKREKHLLIEIEKVQTSLNTKHELNDKRINRSNWMLARLCERNRIPVPEEGEPL